MRSPAGAPGQVGLLTARSAAPVPGFDAERTGGQGWGAGGGNEVSLLAPRKEGNRPLLVGFELLAFHEVPQIRGVPKVLSDHDDLLPSDHEGGGLGVLIAAAVAVRPQTVLRVADSVPLTAVLARR